MLVVAWPFGSSARFADPGGAQTRGAWPESSRRAQTMRALSPGSAALLHHTTRPGESNEIRWPSITEYHGSEYAQGDGPTRSAQTWPAI